MSYPLRKKLSHLTLAAIAYVLFAGLKLFVPFEAASNLGGFLGRHLGSRLGLTRRAGQNLKKAFPQLTPTEINQIALEMWDNMGRVIFEYPYLIRLTQTLWDKHVTVEGAEHLERITQTKQPVIMVSGHLGNWELNALTAFKYKLFLTMIYRKPNNHLVDDLLQKARGHGLIANFYPKGTKGAKELVKAVKRQDSIGMLADQKLNEGEELNFFGHPAMTSTAPADFHLKYKMPIYMARVIRLKGAHFKVQILPLKADYSQDLSHHEKCKIISQHINDCLENWIQEYPAQWLWLHRRWKQ